ncbi:DUF3015 domain-containing protein [bacterium]|nr:DUF3015 domain-containing protein [bacterium]
MILKKALAAGGIALVISPMMAHAQRKYGMAGCGLGSVVMGPRGSQISAYTTNGTSGTQIYGITSGTSNCQPDRKGARSEAQESFMFSNYATLSKEMAQGAGTTLAGLAHVLGCGETDLAAFNKVAQTEHHKIFSSPGAVAALETLKESIVQNETLAQNCKYASVSSTEGVK